MTDGLHAGSAEPKKAATAAVSCTEDTIKPKKRLRPDPDCPICHGQGLKAGNFTGDLVNCDCMEEDD